LPLAIAAPTPVSAMVHSSTLVIAGLYVIYVCDSFLSLGYRGILLCVAIITLVVARFSIIWESDFKKVVALSTSVHLALILAIYAVVGGIFIGVHISYHALFKSLLFVGVGILILVLIHDQDIRGVRRFGVFSG